MKQNLAPWAQLALVADAYDSLTAIDDPQAQEAAGILRSYLAPLAPGRALQPDKHARDSGPYRWEGWAKRALEVWRRKLPADASDQQVSQALQAFRKTLRSATDQALAALPSIPWSAQWLKEIADFAGDNFLVMGAGKLPSLGAVKAGISRARELLQVAREGTQEALAAAKGKLGQAFGKKVSPPAKPAADPVAKGAGLAATGAAAAAAAGAAAGAAGTAAGAGLAASPTVQAGAAVGIGLVALGAIWAFSRRKGA